MPTQRPHVLVPPGATLPTAKDLAGLSYIREGTTTNFIVFYDGALGANGKSLADVVLASCEADYSLSNATRLPDGLFRVDVKRGERADFTARSS